MRVLVHCLKVSEKKEKKSWPLICFFSFSLFGFASVKVQRKGDLARSVAPQRSREFHRTNKLTNNYMLEPDIIRNFRVGGDGAAASTTSSSSEMFSRNVAGASICRSLFLSQVGGQLDHPMDSVLKIYLLCWVQRGLFSFNKVQKLYLL